MKVHMSKELFWMDALMMEETQTFVYLRWGVDASSSLKSGPTRRRTGRVSVTCVVGRSTRINPKFAKDFYGKGLFRVDLLSSRFRPFENRKVVLLLPKVFSRH